MKPLTITALLLGVAGLFSCGAKGDNASDSTAEAIKSFVAPSDDASGASMEAEPSEQSSRSSASGRQKIRIADAYCKHQLGNQAGNNYHPRNMTDGNPATAWAAKLEQLMGDEEPENLMGPIFKFAEPSKIDGIEIQNGYCKNAKSFRNNSRPSMITIYRYTPENESKYNEWGYLPDSEIIYQGPLKDSMKPQYLKVNPGFDNSHPTSGIGLVFGRDCFYWGDKWFDVCISEISVFGR